MAQTLQVLRDLRYLRERTELHKHGAGYLPPVQEIEGDDMKILELPVAVAVNDNELSFVVTLERGGDSHDETFRFNISLLLNGVATSVKTKVMCLHDMTCIAAATELLADELNRATKQLCSEAMVAPLLQLREMIIGLTDHSNNKTGGGL